MKAERYSPALLLCAALASCLFFTAAPSHAQQEDIKGGVGEIIKNTNNGRTPGASRPRTPTRAEREAALRAAREKAACERAARESEQRLAEERAARLRAEQQAAEERKKREQAEARAARLEAAEERVRRAAAEYKAPEVNHFLDVTPIIRRNVVRVPSSEPVRPAPAEGARPVPKIETRAEYGVTDDYRIGMRIGVQFDPDYLEDGDCAAMAYFHKPSGEKLKQPEKASSSRYATPDGQVSVRESITRRFAGVTGGSVVIFMPYSEFPFLPGGKNLKFNVHLKCAGRLVARSDYVDFSLNDKPE